MSSITANAEVTGLTAVSDPPGTWKIRGIFLRWISLERLIQVITSPITVLFGVVIALLVPGIAHGEFFYHVDEQCHAMNGLFFRDLILDFPWRHPVQYLFDYYAKYPGINFPYWPPLFHMVEGLFFLVFGPTVWASRLAVLFFALMAVYFWYRIAERLGPRYLAFLSVILLITVPVVLFHARVTMLEIPALATCLGVAHFWLKFLDKERRRDLWALAGFIVASFLISQKAIFLVPFLVFSLIVERRFRLLRRADVWLALVVSLIPVVSWYGLTFRHLDFTSNVAGSHFDFLSSLYNFTTYPEQLRDEFGVVLGLLVVFGLIVAAWKRSPSHRFLLTWALAGYLTFTFIHDKEVRYAIQWLPPLIYLGLASLETLLMRRSRAIIAASALTLVFLVSAFRTQRPIVDGVRDVANFVVSQQESDVIYYQGHLERDFIFWVRVFDPQKQRLVAKQKQLSDMVGLSSPERTPSSEDEILNWFQTMGIRYAVVQNGDIIKRPNEVSDLAPMFNLLRSDKFELVKTFPIQTNQPDVLTRQIQVFRYRGELHRAKVVVVPVGSIGQGIPIDLSRLAGRPWPK